MRRAIHYLRRILPNVEQFIAIDSKALRWRHDAPATVDVVEFEQAIRSAHCCEASAGAETAQLSELAAVQAALERAVALYQGKLLPNCYDEWIEPEQERLHQACIRVYTWLIQQLQTQKDYSAACRYAQQLLRVDPLNEAAYGSLMQLHALSGDRANALQVYHRCMTVLREELGVDPSPTTRKLYEHLLLEDELPDHTSTAQFSTSARPHPLLSRQPLRSKCPLVGRESEWNLIQQWISLISSGAVSEVLLVLGEPGIGKTRLLEELREAMPSAIWGRGFAAEMVRPYGIWIDALRSLAIPPSVNIPIELGFLLPEMGQPAIAAPDRSHLFDAVVQLLVEWAHQNPIVVILDDIQWIDEASSALLHYAIRLLSHSPVRFACTARSGELEQNGAISRVVQALRREQRLRMLELQPFDRGKTAELIRSIKPSNASDLSLEVVDRVFIDSGGNPLFALEVARAVSQKVSHNQSAHANDLEALIGDRLQQLDHSAREFLPWAAALGRSFNPTMVAQVADRPLPHLLTAIEQLERQSIIRPSTSVGNEMGYDFAHDIVRQVVYRQLSEPRRHLVHLQIAHKLNQISTSDNASDNALAGDIAYHASLGGDHFLAASTALLAAERCLKLFAYAEAATVAQRGIQHCQRLDERTRIHWQLGLLRICAIAGVTSDRAVQLETEIQRLVSDASRLGLKDDEAIGLESLGVLSFNQSNFIDVHHHSLRAIEVGRAASPVTAARLLAFSGSCLAELGQDLIRAEALLLEAQSLADRVGLELGDIYIGLGGIHLHNNRYEAARTLLQQSWRLAQVEQDHWRECNSLTYLIMTELAAGDAIAALSYCQEAAIMAAKIKGEGSESAITAALTALVNYKLQQPGSEVVLEDAIARLKQIDIKRMLAYVGIGSAEVDLEHQRFEMAAGRAEAALQAAQMMNHPSETALAWAMFIQAILELEEHERAIAQFKALQSQIDHHVLSTRAQTALDRVAQQIQRAISVTFHNPSDP
nr:BTAD domain-containing putative transcriptional regulator [Myxacorys almedinensis]